jgi:protein-tyrosine phosphatase
VREYRAGLIDRDGGTPSQELVLEAVHMTVAWYQDGLRVLVRCRAGMNRSGLIAALALTELTDMTYDQAVQHLRRTRGRYVLYNPMLYSFGKTLNQNT